MWQSAIARQPQRATAATRFGSNLDLGRAMILLSLSEAPRARRAIVA
jgi:hypothetical protein